jgi:hypothetical protein
MGGGNSKSSEPAPTNNLDSSGKITTNNLDVSSGTGYFKNIFTNNSITGTNLYGNLIMSDNQSISGKGGINLSGNISTSSSINTPELKLSNGTKSWTLKFGDPNIIGDTTSLCIFDTTKSNSSDRLVCINSSGFLY